MWQVLVKKKIQKNIDKLPLSVKQRLFALLEQIEEKGPIRKEWQNFSELEKNKNKYHCHLTYRYVACWEVLKDKKIIVEVYYVGSRENAPY